MNVDDPLCPADRGVAVFGASEAVPGDPAWERAFAVGRALGEAGVAVVTGGYGGVMEAASRGAREAGGEAIGVTCRAFRSRRPNPALTTEIEEETLFLRTARLFALSRGAVVLDGRAGTLAELAMLWAHARAGDLAGPIVIWDDVWASLARDLAACGRLEGVAHRATRIATDAGSAVRFALEPLVPGAPLTPGGADFR